MRRVFERILQVAGLCLLTAFGGCSAGPMIDRLPADFGLPASAPARPEKPLEYPAVHDMPPARSSVPMTEEEQVKTEKELTALRDRQEGRSPAKKKAAAPAKKPPTAAQNGQTTGAKPNP
jgi:hypothetical protein